MRQITKQHWFCIMPLLPFVAMIAAHEAYGIPDGLLSFPEGQGAPTIAETVFNLLTALAFCAGVAGYLLHTARLAPRGAFWVVVKIIALAVGWYAALRLLE
jgi:hypothetical protein